MELEDILREAFQNGRQWVQDSNNDKEPLSFNDWFNSEETQGKLKSFSHTPIKDCSTCKHNAVSEYLEPCYGCQDKGGYDNHEREIIKTDSCHDCSKKLSKFEDGRLFCEGCLKIFKQ